MTGQYSSTADASWSSVAVVFICEGRWWVHPGLITGLPDNPVASQFKALRGLVLGPTLR